MISTDFHMHSTHSLDGSNSIAELCEQALTLGLTHIAVTDHVEWMPSGSHQRPDFDRYFDEVNECRNRYSGQGLTLLSGLELGNPHEHRAEVETLLSSYPFDVVIGSMHWLNGQNIHYTSCFDGQDPYDVYSAYFRQIGKIAASVDCRIIAHFDRIFWPGSARFGPPEIELVEESVRYAVRAMAEHGRILELNTRFLTHEPSWNTSLRKVLRWYKEEGGQFVAVNSDAHRISEIGRNRTIGEELIMAAGCLPYTAQVAAALVAQ